MVTFSSFGAVSALEKDCIRLEYGQKIKLMALYKQEKLGTYSAEKDTETGYLDIIGSDRRYV